MSRPAMDWFWANVASDPQMDPTCKWVLSYICDNANHDGGSFFHAPVTIGRAIGASERTVQRWLARMVKDGVLVVEAPPHGRRPTTYRVVGVAPESGVTDDTRDGSCPGDTRDTRDSGSDGVGCQSGDTRVSRGADRTSYRNQGRGTKATPTPDGDGRAPEGSGALFDEATAARPPRPNQVRADALARQTWEALETKPLGGQRPFLEWRKRVEEALDAGHPPAVVLAAAPEAGGVTRAMWDRALNVVRSRQSRAGQGPQRDLRDMTAEWADEIRTARAGGTPPPPGDFIDAESRPV